MRRSEGTDIRRTVPDADVKEGRMLLLHEKVGDDRHCGKEHRSKIIASEVQEMDTGTV